MLKTHAHWFPVKSSQLVSDVSLTRDLPANQNKSNSSLRLYSGFSLVEVVLALGITSFSLLTILGLLPVGLGVMREANEASTRARIVQKLHGEILLMPFSQLENRFANQTIYFDDAGERVQKDDISSLYQVETKLIAPQYPVSEQAVSAIDINSSLKAIRLQFTKLRSENRDPKNSIIWVPNSGG